MNRKRMSISIKVLLLMLAFILPINILALTVSELILENAREQAEESIHTVITSTLSTLEAKMEQTEYLSYAMRVSDEDGQVLAYQRGDIEYELSRLLFYRKFETTLEITDSGFGIFLYMGELNDMLIWNRSSNLHSDADLREYILADCMGDGDVRGWSLVELSSSYQSEEGSWPILLYITQTTSLYSGGWIELATIREALEENMGFSSAEVQFSLQEPVSDDGWEILVSEYFQDAEMYVSVRLDAREINGKTLLAYYCYRAIAIVLLLSSPFLYFILRKWLITPLNTINTAHAAVERGDLEYRIEDRAKAQEYQKAFDSFNEMAGNLQHLTIDNYEKQIQNQKMELENQRMELRNLQLQIRPHFLLNLFNLIYNLAQEKDMPHVQQAILYLSEYFRYIFRNDKDLDLFSKEASLIEGYIELASVQYPGCIEAEYDYEPVVLCVRVPPLLIHNFVENIIKHVVKRGTVTHILLQGQYDDGMVSIHIMDDGAGIEEEDLVRINERIHSGKVSGEHVGMTNSLLRMRRFYGERADIQVTSEIGIGTDVILTFPYDLEVEEPGQSSGSS